jgi:hypothetical protein
MPEAVAEADALQELPREPPAVAARRTRVEEPVGDVVERAHPVQEEDC